MNLIEGLSPDELVIDNFAGGGGASEGMELALAEIGRHVDIAINHDAKALAMHAGNHPHTRHLCESVWDVDIEAVTEGRPVGLAWFSPDCKHFSKAKGGKPVSKKIRGLAWIVRKWARIKRPRVIVLENVEEFKTWGPLTDGKPCPRRKGRTFKRWVKSLQELGYTVDWRELRGMAYGAPTIRKRLFVVARLDVTEIPWPEETHGTAPLLPYRTAADCIDFSIPCPSIFLTKKEAREIGVNRPLADNTMARIARGLKRYVFDSPAPFIVNMSHGGKVEPIDRPMSTIATEKGGCRAIVIPKIVSLTHHGGDRVEDVSNPMRTITGAHRGEKALVSTYLTQYYGANRPGGDRIGSVEDPLRTQPTENRHALVTAFLAQHNGGPNNNGLTGRAADAPLSTITGRGTQQAIVQATFVSRQFTGSTGSATDEPVGTVTAGGGGKTAIVAATLLHNTTGNPATSPETPLKTITTGNHHAIVTSNLVKLRGTCKDGQRTDDPMPSVCAQGTHVAEVRAFLLKYFGTDQDPRLEDLMHTVTVTSKHRFGLVMVYGELYEIVDICMRMLTPRELFRAQGFRESYVIDGGRDVTSTQGFLLPGCEWIPLNITEQVRMVGNSVCPPVAEAVVRAQFGLKRKERMAA